MTILYYLALLPLLITFSCMLMDKYTRKGVVIILIIVPVFIIISFLFLWGLEGILK